MLVALPRFRSLAKLAELAKVKVRTQCQVVSMNRGNNTCLNDAIFISGCDSLRQVGYLFGFIVVS